ncbi:hypothetical protein PR048_002620 [Dryococelus australis]|uniref:Glucosylceramidase n=1 Tax=Dryococelus australis TaxID=614101 RepID=A0ABQ9IKR0_9NEOP|nr:hypothetical protein PR048_002620 [Dryococelus australis]
MCCNCFQMPFLKIAQEVSPEQVKLFGTAWTAPQWMKEIDNTTGKSSLKKEYYQVYANYYIRFLKSYAKEGIKFWGLTPQNEPGVAIILGKVITMGWTPEEMLQYLVENLCPALTANGYGDLKMMLLDDNRNYVPEWIKILKNDSLRACVNGLALHWYTDKTTSVSILDEAHTEYPDKFMIYSEACPEYVCGILFNDHYLRHVVFEPERNPEDQRVILGNWKDGAQYISSIIQASRSSVSNNWVSGWVDLNMAIGLDGGPNWLNETRNDAPVVVNATADEFYKQPTFYGIAHVSRFVRPGSVRVGLHTGSDSLQGVAFLTPDRVTVVVLHNTYVKPVHD